MSGPMTISEIWRFPVKSMGGETLPAAAVGDLGIEGDRSWSLYDVETGTTLTARRTPELLFAAACVRGGEVVVTLPDGSTAGEDDDDVLSSWLGREVRLRRAADHDRDVGGTYEVPLDPEHDTDWVSWQGPGGAFHDSTRARVSLVSRASLGDWDLRRFRTNVVVDGPTEPGAEDDLVGSTLEVGALRLTVRKRIDRCVMVSRPQPGLDRDLDVLRTINAERETCLAIGCLVDTPGEIAVGSPISTVRPGV